MDYYYSQLTQTQQIFYKKICSEYHKRSTEIKGKNIITAESLRDCITAVKYDHPEFFYVNGQHYSYIDEPDGLTYCPSYLYTEAEVQEKKARLDRIVRWFHSEFRRHGFTSVYDKSCFIHAWFVTQCVYDDDAYECKDLDQKGNDHYKAYSLEGALFHRKAVCLGISLAYRFLCMACGIDCIVVRGVSMHPHSGVYEHHAWNMIFLDNEAVHIDNTWDMCLSNQDCPIRYDYFYLSDIDCMQDHHFINYPPCRGRYGSHFQRFGALIGELSQLDAYFDKLFSGRGPGSTIIVHFKLSDRKIAADEVAQHLTQHLSDAHLMYEPYYYIFNKDQHVFTTAIKLK